MRKLEHDPFFVRFVLGQENFLTDHLKAFIHPSRDLGFFARTLWMNIRRPMPLPDGLHKYVELITVIFKAKDDTNI